MVNRGTIRSVNPADLSDVIGSYAWDAGEVSDAVGRAKRAFSMWSQLPQSRRIGLLKKFKAALSRRSSALAAVITRETGKAIWESKEEVGLLLSKIDITLETAAREIGRIDTGMGAYCVFRPYGVAAVLGPFNFPLHLPHGHIVPALLAGNTVIFKPSDKACAAGELYATCALAAGFPAGVLSVMQGPGSVGEALAVHPDVSMVLFTGSYDVGQRLKKMTMSQPDKLLALEMGGKNAAVVFDDADIVTASAECARSAFLTAGQRCTSTSRIFVQKKVFDKFCRMFVSIAKTFPVGDPTDPEMFCGPLISEESVRRSERAIRDARRLGGEPILPGGAFETTGGYFVRLSAHRFNRYPGRHSYTADELFVPETGIYPFDSLAEARALAEDTDYGLAMSVFTTRRAVFEQMLRDTTHGVVNWNLGTTGASGRLPFGGRKKSGNARPAALFSIRNCVHPVSVRHA